MSGLVSLIIALFSILITVLLLAMASIAMLLLLIVFIFISIVVGVQQQSTLKGLRIFVSSCAVLIITPISALLFKFNLSNIVGVSPNQGLWLGAALGFVVSIVFGILSYRFFKKAGDVCYNYIHGKVK